MNLRYSIIVGRVALALAVSGCERGLFDPEFTESDRPDPTSLIAWHVWGRRAGSSVGRCGAYLDYRLRGELPQDKRQWAVGSFVTLNPVFERPCGGWLFSRPCSTLSWESEIADTSAWRSTSEGSSALYAHEPGIGRVYAKAGGGRWGPLTLRAYAPESLAVSRVMPGFLEEPVTAVALAADGLMQVVVRVFDGLGNHLCGRPSLAATGDGVQVNPDPFHNPEGSANGVLLLEAVDSNRVASAEISVGEVSTRVEIDVVSVSVVTEFSASLIGTWPEQRVRLKAVDGEREVVGVPFYVENLTPSLFAFHNEHSAYVANTREPVVELWANGGGVSGTGRLRVSLQRSTLPPFEFEFTVP